MRLHTLIFLLSIFFYGSLQSQEKSPYILLMTGKTLDGNVTKEDSAFIYFEEVRRKGKTKEVKLDWERGFSVFDEEGVERVIYIADSNAGNYFTETEMRFYIKGEQDAMNGYHANWTTYVGVPLTGGVGFFLSSSPLVFAVPFLYMVGTSMPKYKMEPASISDANLLRQPAYILGYERTARSKRLIKSLVAGVIGAGVGLLVGQLVNQ